MVSPPASRPATSWGAGWTPACPLLWTCSSSGRRPAWPRSEGLAGGAWFCNAEPACLVRSKTCYHALKAYEIRSERNRELSSDRPRWLAPAAARRGRAIAGRGCRVGGPVGRLPFGSRAGPQGHLNREVDRAFDRAGALGRRPLPEPGPATRQPGGDAAAAQLAGRPPDAVASRHRQPASARAAPGWPPAPPR